MPARAASYESRVSHRCPFKYILRDNPMKKTDCRDPWEEARYKIGSDNFLKCGLRSPAVRRFETDPPLSAAGSEGRMETREREGMIMRVCRREVFCERGWGVSLRSTTCKGMVTVPGGELRCTGNLCSERHSRPEVGERDCLTINRLQNIAVLSSSNKKERNKKKRRVDRTWTVEFSARDRCDIFERTHCQLRLVRAIMRERRLC